MKPLNLQRINEISLWDSLLLESSPKFPKKNFEQLPTNEDVQCGSNFLKNILSDIHPLQNQFTSQVLTRLNCSFDEEDIQTNDDSSRTNSQFEKFDPPFVPHIDDYFEKQEDKKKQTLFLNKIDEEISSQIFEERNIKKGWKKNTNVPKFLVRVYMKHFSSYNKEKKNKKFYESHKKARKEIRKVCNNNFKISHIQRLLYDDQNPNSQFQRGNREIMAQIMRNQLKEEVIENTYINDNKLSYLIASKIYAIRCRSKTLTERVKVF